jgi:hypothetical protein
MSFLLPGHYADEFDPNPDIAVARAFDRLLKALDDKLFCFWVKADAVNFENPGRWHVGRLHSNPELNTYWVIQNADGSYCEPQERHLLELKRMDTHSRNVLADVEQARSTRQLAKRKEFEETRREFREKLAERLDSLYDAHVSVPRIPGAEVAHVGGGLLTVTKPKPRTLIAASTTGQPLDVS